MSNGFYFFLVASLVLILMALLATYNAILHLRDEIKKYTQDVNKKHCGVTNIVLTPQDSDDKTIKQITDGFKNTDYKWTHIL